jgi:hypothetical protein
MLLRSIAISEHLITIVLEPKHMRLKHSYLLSMLVAPFLSLSSNIAILKPKCTYTSSVLFLHWTKVDLGAGEGFPFLLWEDSIYLHDEAWDASKSQT